MQYPYCLFQAGLRTAPLFKRKGPPYMLDLSNSGPLRNEDPGDPVAYQSFIGRLMGRMTWGFSPYLEKRDHMLQHFPQMASEERWYHLGVDILLPLGAQLHSPIEAVVVETGYEEGAGNYGGFAVLRYSREFMEPFFSLFGHLNKNALPEKGRVLKPGDVFCRIGDFHENGGWYHHTHLQIITVRGMEEGFLSRGYCSGNSLGGINALCPSPVPLLIRSLYG